MDSVNCLLNCDCSPSTLSLLPVVTAARRSGAAGLVGLQLDLALMTAEYEA